MQSNYSYWSKIWTFVVWSLGLTLKTALWAAPTIQSMDVSPNPLVLGQPVTLVVAASADVTQAIATIDFRPGVARLLRVVLSKQGQAWTGTAQIPADLRLPSGAGATIKALALDASRQHVERVLSAPVATQTTAISAVFAAGILTVTGDDADNTLVVGRDAAGNLLVNGGAIAISGGAPTVANTSRIRIFGRAGNDNLSIDDSAGPMPSASLFGEEGDDTLTGSQSADELDGGPGDDTLFGRGGADRLLGGPGDDTLVGGRDADQIFGGDGNDQIIWNPGDGSDLVEGENGEDTLVFNGANIAENVDLSSENGRLRFTRNVAGITMDCGGVERVIFRALAGADNVTINDLDGTDVTEVVADLSATGGGADEDPDVVVVNGSDGSEIFTVTDAAGAVEVRGLAALVRIIGSDAAHDQLILKGQGGTDLVDFIGSDEDEQASFSADGARLLFSNSRGSIRFECESMHQVNFRALGGSDQVVVNDLTGTGVARIGVDLSGATIGIGDGRPDTVVINGTQGDDTITLDEAVIGITVNGLSAQVAIVGGEPGTDELVIDALAGADVINASLIEPGEIDLTLRGGADRDLLIGGQGNDLLIGGRGDDVLSGGPGDDTFVWNPGDGSDVIEGDAGDDTLVFNGANIAEEFVFAPLGPHLRLSRNVATIAMDCSSVELVELNTLGGADKITIQDLSPTTVRAINLNLGASGGAPDESADTIVVTGTAGPDSVHISGSAGIVHVQGLAAAVNISGADPTLDQLLISLMEGDDLTEATGLQAGLINLSIDGGPGDDVLVGSPGPDALFGGPGDDVLQGGPGFDVLDGGPGSNVLIQD